MVAYKMKVMHVRDDTITLAPITKNENVYPWVDKNFDDDSGTVLPYYGYLVGIDISDKDYLSSNNMFTSTDSVPHSLQNGCINEGHNKSKTDADKISPFTK